LKLPIKILLLAGLSCWNMHATSNLEYSGVIKPGLLFTVSSNLDNSGQVCFSVTMGPPNNLQDVVVYQATRYRDGGTTNIRTQKGDFYFPSPYRLQGPATFNDQPILAWQKGADF
jgi:hypothetical protein